jgi:thiol-disulfide isomerase/thioredoxin
MLTVVLICRLVLSAVFAVAGTAKLLDREGSRKSFAEFGVPVRLARPLAWLLPLTELACAVALIPASSGWWGALGATALLALFTILVVTTLARGRRPKCHCFGQLQSATVGWTTVLRNSVFAGLSGFVVWNGRGGGGAQMSDPFDMGMSVGPIEPGLVFMALAVAAVMGSALIGLFFLLRQNGRLLLRIEALEAQVGLSADASEPGLPVNSRAPSFSLKNLDGRIVTLDALLGRGRPVLLFFSEPGCGACDAALPELARWQCEHRDRLCIVPIAGGDASLNLETAGKHGLQEVLLGTADVAAAYRVQAWPSAVLIADGLIASRVATGIVAIRDLVGTVTMPESIWQPGVPALAELVPNE